MQCINKLYLYHMSLDDIINLLIKFSTSVLLMQKWAWLLTGDTPEHPAIHWMHKSVGLSAVQQQVTETLPFDVIVIPYMWCGVMTAHWFSVKNTYHTLDVNYFLSDTPEKKKTLITAIDDIWQTYMTSKVTRLSGKDIDLPIMDGLSGCNMHHTNKCQRDLDNI